MPCIDCSADIATQEGDLICERCTQQHHIHCTSCREWHRADASCQICVTCDRCEQRVEESQTVQTARGSTICPSCRYLYWQCSSCEQWNRDGNDCGNGCCDPDDCDCSDCTDHDRLIYDYDYKPVPVFHGGGPLFLGPEIEVETPTDGGRECAEIALGHLRDLGYLKEDSSIGYGFEIVTHPMSYEWAITNFPWPMLTELENAGCTTSDDTGIHIHLSRAGFASTGHVFRWMKFIYRNQPQVLTVARRENTHWAAFTADDRDAVKHYAKGARGDRHRAINTNNSHTLELRIFASSLDPEQVKSSLAFAAASVEYTRTLTVGGIVHRGGWTWPAFVGWVSDRAIYAPLTEQLEQLQCVC